MAFQGGHLGWAAGMALLRQRFAQGDALGLQLVLLAWGQWRRAFL